MKKNLLLLILCMGLMACKKQQHVPEGPIGGAVMQHHTYLWLKNSSGQNLLNSATPNSIDPALIEVYNLNSYGQKVPYVDGTSNKSNGLAIKGDMANGYYLFFTFQGAIKINNRATCFLKYADGREDKITAQLSQYRLEKIWVNDVLVGEIDGKNFIDKVEIIK